MKTGKKIIIAFVVVAPILLAAVQTSLVASYGIFENMLDMFIDFLTGVMAMSATNFIVALIFGLTKKDV